MIRIIKLITIFLVVAFCATSCQSKNKSSHLERLKKIYKEEVFSSYPLQFDTLLNPRSYDLVLYPESYYASGFSGIFIVQKFEDLKELEGFEKQLKSLETKHNNCGPITIPGQQEIPCSNPTFIPDYGNEFIEELRGFTNETVVNYIFNSEKGFYFLGVDNEHVQHIGIPHGFSNGLTLDKRNFKVVYWIIVW